MAKKKPETQAEAQPSAAAAPAACPPPRPRRAPGRRRAAERPDAHGFRRKLVGKVTSSKMNKTVVVEVVRSSLDPVYKRYVRSRARYKAHDETNQFKVGDRVEIQEHRPISRDKRWLVTRLVARPAEE